MLENYQTLEEATKALTATAQRAATLMREESDRSHQEAVSAREEAERAWGEIESVRGDIAGAKADIDAVRSAMMGGQSETQRLRTSARTAWGTVGVMGVVMMVGVGWTASVLTRGSSRITHLNEQLTELTANGEHLSSELSFIRGECETARVAQARAEGELRAVSYTRTAMSDVREPLDLQFNSAPIKLASIKEMIGRLLSEMKFGESMSANDTVPIIPEPAEDVGETSDVLVGEVPDRE